MLIIMIMPCAFSFLWHFPNANSGIFPFCNDFSKGYYLKSWANHPRQFTSQRDFASFMGCKLPANTMQVLRCDPSLQQAQQGAQMMADVPRSLKT